MVEISEEELQKIKHMSYFCPGLHDPGNKQDVIPMTMTKLFQIKGRITIPLFQRSYCWGASSLVETYWRDISKSDEFNPHRVGKIIFKRDNPNDLLCVDGQQRITTTQLFLFAVRDAALQFEGNEKLVDHIHQLIFADKAEGEGWISAAIEGLKEETTSWEHLLPDGQELTFSKLIPSFLDRKPYFEHMMLGPIRAASKCEIIPSKEFSESHQGKGKMYFDHQIDCVLKAIKDPKKALKKLMQLARSASDFLALTYVEIINDVNLPQIFCWFQEKTLLS